MFQIWIHPKSLDIDPRWESAVYNDNAHAGCFQLLVSGREDDAGKGALYIHQDASIWSGQIPAQARLTHALRGSAYLLVAQGEIVVEGRVIRQGDGAEIENLASIDIETHQESHVFMIEL